MLTHEPLIEHALVGGVLIDKVQTVRSLRNNVRGTYLPDKPQQGQPPGCRGR
jgi:hypothetical protein